MAQRKIVTISIKSKKLRKKTVRKLFPEFKKSKKKKILTSPYVFPGLQLKDDIKLQKSSSHYLYVSFKDESMRGGFAYGRVLESFGSFFSPKVQPVLLAPYGADVSNTPRGRFESELSAGVSYHLEIKSNSEVVLHYPVNVPQEQLVEV